MILKDGSVAAFGDPKDVLNDEDSVKVITQIEEENLKEKENSIKVYVIITTCLFRPPISVAQLICVMF